MEARQSAAAQRLAGSMSGVQGLGRESSIYRHRFSAAEEQARTKTWEVLVPEFFGRYLAGAQVVVDVGAGDGHFIRHVQARRRIGVDLSEHVHELAQHGVEVMQTTATDFAQKIGERADVIFMSNFLEHLPNKRILLEVLEECRLALRPGGLLLVLQPNIRYVGPAYWDYVDHQIALTEHSLSEALDISGFELLELVPRFLSYTARSILGRAASPRAASFVRFYLRFPILWRLLGKQTFAVATPR